MNHPGSPPNRIRPLVLPVDNEPAIPAWFDAAMCGRLAPFLAACFDAMPLEQLDSLEAAADADPRSALVIRVIGSTLHVAGADRVVFYSTAFRTIANEVLQ